MELSARSKRKGFLCAISAPHGFLFVTPFPKMLVDYRGSAGLLSQIKRLSFIEPANILDKIHASFSLPDEAAR